MKRFHITLTSLLVAFGAMLSTAHADLKVASVKMDELNIMFYKRVVAEASLKKQEAEIKEEINARVEAVRALKEEIEQLQKSIDPTLSEAAAKSLREKSAAKVNEFTAKQEELKTFIQRREVAFREVVRRELTLLANDLHKTVEAVAAEGNYDLVVDASAVGAQAKVFPYVKPELDISAAVLKRLNADAPASYDPQAELERARNGAAAPEATPAQ